MYFRYSVDIVLGNGHAPLFEQAWIPFTQKVDLCQILLQLA